MTYPAGAGRVLLDVRRLAAVDMYGRRGGMGRRRLVLAEFVLAAIDIPFVGLAVMLAASSAPSVLLGIYLTGVGLNYVPLGLHAVSLARPGRLDAEVAGADIGAELRHYTARQFAIAIPLLVLILGAVQLATCSRAAGAPKPVTGEA